MMKPGDDYHWPQCGKNTFLKKEAVMDGWTKKGDVLKCAACGHLACSLAPEVKTEKADPLKSAAADRFKNLLGADDFEKKPEFNSSGDEKHFCKDCQHLIPHPFVNRCVKFGKDVNPMDDCPSFTKKNQ